MRGRAFRRHHKQRMYEHAKHILHDVWHEDQWFGEWTEKDIHSYIAGKADNFTSCSCEMCRNERRSNWCSGDEKLTMQERKQNEKFKTELDNI